MAIRRTRPVPIGGLTDMVLIETRVGLELRIGDPAMAHRRVARDQFVEPALDLRFVERSLARIEIEPPLRVADRSSRHRIGRDDRKQMQGRVGAHAFQAQVPVDAGDHARARAGQGGPFGGHVQNGRAIRVIDRVDDRNHRPVFEQNRPLIAALSSALRVKDRAIEHNAARFRGEHGRFRLGLIRVLAKEGLSHCTNT